MYEATLDELQGDRDGALRAYQAACSLGQEFACNRARLLGARD